MPIRPQPFNMRCPICNWTKYCQPKSDCFSSNDVPMRCKRCGSTDLQFENGRYLRLKAFLRSHFDM